MAESGTYDENAPVSHRVGRLFTELRELFALARALRGLDSSSARRLLEARGMIGPADLAAGAGVRILYRLMRLLGLDRHRLGEADPGLLQDLERTCDGCGHRDRCESDHENGSARTTYQNYCPNAAKLDALRFAQVGDRAA
jgi:hypothetical protein